MKIAHLILAHNNPRQLAQLVRRLTYADDAVYIHLDKKTPATPFNEIKKLNNVYFISNRVPVKWGAYSIVQATLNGFAEILGTGIDYDFVNLLSGCDYPLQNPAGLHGFLSGNPQQAFMSYQPINTEWLEAMPRIQMYHLTNYTFLGSHSLQKLLNLVLPKRKMPYGLVPVGRSQWFTVPLDCVRYMMDYWKNHAAFRRFVKLTWGPDEFVFQTILYNSAYRGSMVNDNLRYIDWSGGGASPKTFTLADKDSLLASGKWFARKFDLYKHADILHVLDQKLDDVNNPFLA